jgi:hypothetical protein
MTRAAFSLRAFSIYMFCLGAVLVVAPNVLLTLFGVAETREVWIRIVGMLILILGYLDFMAAGSELQPYIRWTVPVRLSVPVFLIAFVALGYGPPVLILFGAIDAGGAIWTAIGLRRDAAAAGARGGAKP